MVSGWSVTFAHLFNEMNCVVARTSSNNSVWAETAKIIIAYISATNKNEISLSLFFVAICSNNICDDGHDPCFKFPIVQVGTFIEHLCCILWQVYGNMATNFNLSICRKINGRRCTMPKTIFCHWKSSVVEPVAVPQMVYQNQYTTHPMKNWPTIERQRCRQSIRLTSKYMTFGGRPKTTKSFYLKLFEFKLF